MKNEATDCEAHADRPGSDDHGLEDVVKELNSFRSSHHHAMSYLEFLLPDDVTAMDRKLFAQHCTNENSGIDYGQMVTALKPSMTSLEAAAAQSKCP